MKPTEFDIAVHDMINDGKVCLGCLANDLAGNTHDDVSVWDFRTRGQYGSRSDNTPFTHFAAIEDYRSGGDQRP